MRKKRPTKEEMEGWNRDQLKQEMVKTIAGSIMPILQTCIEMRVSQWFDVIAEKLEEKTNV